MAQHKEYTGAEKRLLLQDVRGLMMQVQNCGAVQPLAGTLRLGQGTPSYDAEAEVDEVLPWDHITGQAQMPKFICNTNQPLLGAVSIGLQFCKPSEIHHVIADEDIAAAQQQFLGDQMQLPPMFSALKVGPAQLLLLMSPAISTPLLKLCQFAPVQVKGERLYFAARRGEQVERQPRAICITSLELDRDTEERQDIHFKVACSKGTYVRTLVHDLVCSQQYAHDQIAKPYGPVKAVLQPDITSEMPYGIAAKRAQTELFCMVLPAGQGSRHCGAHDGLETHPNWRAQNRGRLVYCGPKHSCGCIARSTTFQCANLNDHSRLK